MEYFHEAEDERDYSSRYPPKDSGPYGKLTPRPRRFDCSPEAQAAVRQRSMVKLQGHIALTFCSCAIAQRLANPIFQGQSQVGGCHSRRISISDAVPSRCQPEHRVHRVHSHPKLICASFLLTK